jgi:hypothetical protein
MLKRWQRNWIRTAWRCGLRHPGGYLRGISSDSATWTHRVGVWLLRRWPSRLVKLSPWELGAVAEADNRAKNAAGPVWRA